MTRSLVLSVVLALSAAASASAEATLSSVEIPVATPSVATPPPTARACRIDLGGRRPVVTACPRTCYSEWWNGPLLEAQNTCEETIWVAYEFLAADGRTYRTPCYELTGRSAPVVIPDPAIESEAPRSILVSQDLGVGWPPKGHLAQCADHRVRVPEEDVRWGMGEEDRARR